MSEAGEYKHAGSVVYSITSSFSSYTMRVNMQALSLELDGSYNHHGTMILEIQHGKVVLLTCVTSVSFDAHCGTRE